MKIFLKVWRQKSAKEKGCLVDYRLDDVSSDLSFLEMLDLLNETLVKKGESPVVFDHDCREGICGCCSLMINGEAHGPSKSTTTCQLYMRKFKDGDTIVIEPFRAYAFPLLCDLMVDRKAFDHIIASGGYISANVGQAPEANSTRIALAKAEVAMDAAQCIGCGACVASCKNASAMLFVSAKVSHLAHLPQGEVEGRDRVKKMVATMDRLGFGPCSNEKECEAQCPKNIKITHIAKLNREFLRASLT